MDALKKTCKGHTQVFFEPLTKVFFKKYFYKVEVQLDLYIPRVAARRIAFRGTRYAHAMRLALNGCKFQQDYSTRRQGSYCSFFFTNESDTREFVRRNKSYVVLIVAPRHDGDTLALGDDAKIRLRDTLFWNAFRWSITFKGMKDNIYEDLRTNVCEAFGLDPETAHTSPRLMFGYTYPRKIFMNSEQDVILLKMMAQEHIGKIEKAVLRSEIDDQR